jgi:hypothetical protein
VHRARRGGLLKSCGFTAQTTTSARASRARSLQGLQAMMLSRRALQCTVDDDQVRRRTAGGDEPAENGGRHVAATDEAMVWDML